MTSTVDKVTSAATRVGGALVSRIRSAVGATAAPAGGSDPTAAGWLVVTVLCGSSDIDTADLPGPLAQLADRIEVRVAPAPGDKGTELAARLRARPQSSGAADRLTGSDPQADLRIALRRSKQLIEVGEVLSVEPAPHGERPATPGGALVESWTTAAPAAGVR